MVVIFRFAALYAAIVFALGFALGTLRILFLAPVAGELAAAIVEVPLMLALSWAFVVARLAHAAVHVTSNRLRFRFMTFVAGLVILMAMWALFLVQLLLAPA